MNDLNGSAVELGVSEFIAVFNQTLDFAYPEVVITGELANFRVSKNRWVYFDLKDEQGSLKFFGSVYNLPGPLEDGLMLRVKGQPHLHNLYGFSINIINIMPAGEGSLRRAADLLMKKLAAEGLFDESRKRPLPHPPKSIGLVTSKESAAYADFIKILNARWRGLGISLVDVQVQGEPAPEQIAAAIARLNNLAEVDAIVIIRGGGSAEDLAAFSSEVVTRAVAASRLPTLVAIGHETDWSLAEMAADLRASTPSNAAELLVPDISQAILLTAQLESQLHREGTRIIKAARLNHDLMLEQIETKTLELIRQAGNANKSLYRLLMALNPQTILNKGYAIVRKDQQVIRSAGSLAPGDMIEIQMTDGFFKSQVK